MLRLASVRGRSLYFIDFDTLNCGTSRDDFMSDYGNFTRHVEVSAIRGLLPPRSSARAPSMERGTIAANLN